MTLKPHQNPLFEPNAGQVVFDCKTLSTPYSVRSHVPTKVEILKLLRKQTAAEAIGELYAGCAIFGITKGQFSLIELIAVLLEQNRPARPMSFYRPGPPPIRI